MDWRTGWFQADGSTIEELLIELNRYSASPIEVSDKILAQQAVVGRFRLDETDTILENLAILYNFTISKNERSIKLLPINDYSSH